MVVMGAALAPSDAAYWSKEMFWLLLGLLVACWLCAWLKPGTDLASSAARAFDSSVLLLSRGGTDPATSDDDNEDDEDASYRRRPVRSAAPRQPAAPLKTSAIRKRVTPLLQKRVAARYGFKCAICGVAVGSRPHCPIELCAKRRGCGAIELNRQSPTPP